MDARDAFRRGEAAYSAGNYDLAIREWNSAYSVDPRPRIQFNLSQAYERTGDLPKAIDALRKFLDAADPEDPTYSDANARLSALQQRVASTGVLVRGGAEGGLILVDEQDWGRTPRPDKIALSPGSHVLVVRWPSQPEFRTNVFVPAGQVIEVQLPADSGTTGTSTTTTTGTATTTTGTTSTGGGGSKSVLWYAIGGGTAAVGAGLLVYGIVRGGDVVDCGGEYYCPDPGASDSAKTQSIVGYALGGTLIAAGAAMIVIGALSKDEDKQQAKSTCGIGWASASCRFQF